MDELIIEATDSTPQVNFDKESGTFVIKGKSFPEESRSFFAPIQKWLENYEKEPNEETYFIFKMEYFNSSSSLIILEILNVLDSIFKSGKKVTVSWSYLEIDDDMRDAGEEYAELVTVPFEFHGLEEDEF